MKQKILDFLHSVQCGVTANALDIKLPVKIKVKSTLDFGGFYQNKVTARGQAYHKITISTHSEQNENILQMRESMIHELIHAWQYENGKKVGHGKSFKKWVGFFKEAYHLNVE